MTTSNVFRIAIRDCSGPQSVYIGTPAEDCLLRLRIRGCAHDAIHLYGRRNMLLQATVGECSGYAVRSFGAQNNAVHIKGATRLAPKIFLDDNSQSNLLVSPAAISLDDRGRANHVLRAE